MRAEGLWRWIVQKWQRRGLRVLASVLLGALLLLVALNTGLNLGVTRPWLSRLISVDPQSFDLDYERAWSPFPSFVYVRGVKLRGNDENVQWQIDVEEARVRVDVMALFSRQFHATRVEAKGIGLRLRQKLEAAEASSDRVAPLPPIAGFARKPLRDAAPPGEALPVVPYDLWSVHLENVEGIARQIWIDEIRFDGLVKVKGAFFLQPKRKLSVGPAHADIVSGTANLGDIRLADGLSGSADCQIPSFDPSVPVGIQYYRHISGAVRLDAKITSVRVLDYYARIRGLPVQFIGGNGALHLEGALQRGVLRPLRADLTLRDVEAKSGEWNTTVTMDATVRTGANGASVWVARVAPLSLLRGEAVILRIDDAPLRVSALVPSIDLSRATQSLEIEVDLPRMLAPDLRVFNPYVASPGGLHVDGGRASITAQGVVSTGPRSATGSASVEGEAVTLRYDTLRLSGRFSASAQVTKLDLGSGDVDASEVKIRIRELQVRDSVRTVSGWWGNVQSQKAELRVTRAIPFSAGFTSQFQNAAPVLAFSSHTPALPGWVVGFLSGGTMSASGHVRAGSGIVQLTELEAKTGLLRVQGSYHKRHAEKTGAFQIGAGPLSVGIELRNEETKLIFIGRTEEPRLMPSGHPKVD